MAKQLPYKTFLKTFELVPRVAPNLAIFDEKGRILLTKRAIPPFPDTWHLPGSFLLKGESINDCLKRIAKKELGIILNVKKTKLLAVYEDLELDPRGHVVDIIYEYRVKTLKFKLTDESKDIQFFDRIPKNMGFNHGDYLVEWGF
jgi:ADP-ribose pyrophosphatase YjhB (NUDIX family)